MVHLLLPLMLRLFIIQRCQGRVVFGLSAIATTRLPAAVIVTAIATIIKNQAIPHS
jgi:hypothetical protein